MQVQLNDKNASALEKLREKFSLCGVISTTKLVNSIISLSVQGELSRQEISANLESEIKNFQK